jgi:hypothetical protein
MGTVLLLEGRINNPAQGAIFLVQNQVRQGTGAALRRRSHASLKLKHLFPRFSGMPTRPYSLDV